MPMAATVAPAAGGIRMTRVMPAAMTGFCYICWVVAFQKTRPPARGATRAGHAPVNPAGNPSARAWDYPDRRPQHILQRQPVRPRVGLPAAFQS